MASIIDGKKISLEIREEIKKEVSELTEKYGRAPGLAVILVGDDPASDIYVRSKETACIKAGIESTTVRLPADIPEEELLKKIGELRDDPRIDGILLQVPLPPHIDENKAIFAIPPEKDVDGFHPINLGKLLIGEKSFRPATPSGIMELLKRSGIPLEGKHAVVIGRSNIVGKPMAFMLMEKNATITICHSRTKDLNEIVRSADIVVAAVGKPELVKGDWIKPGAVVIDAGTNSLPDGRPVGDVAFDEAKDIASAITPVPGGVGPMTIAILLSNTLDAYKASLRR